MPSFAAIFSAWLVVSLAKILAENFQLMFWCRSQFVLMGDGLLRGEMRSALAMHEKTGAVTFTGMLPQAKVAEYLDAADILVSPHLPMPDGSRFFGSPTKVFEYMAMGKGIVSRARASRHRQEG